jgi:hypothetical protein
MFKTLFEGDKKMNLKNKRSWLYFMSTLCEMGQQHQMKKKSENRLKKKNTSLD